MIKKYDDADFEALQMSVKALLTALIVKGVLNQNDYENALDEFLNMLFEEIRERKKELEKKDREKEHS
jgi:NADPH-dependent curcumin reductase CurA